MDYIELVPGLKTKGSSAVSKDKQWKIIENTDFESDL